MTVKVAVIYYSATGSVHALAQAVAEGAASAGAEVRLRPVTELAPDDAINQNPRWRRHADATASITTATLEDLVRADAFAFGTPTRFGTPAAQLKQFIDQAGGLWREGKLADKPVTAFTSAFNRHGGSEATILSLGNVFYHWGALIVPPGYTAAFGYGPAVLVRILRLQRFLRLARMQLPPTGLADMALSAGYCDQQHLTHDIRAILGTTPMSLLRTSDPYKT